MANSLSRFSSLTLIVAVSTLIASCSSLRPTSTKSEDSTTGTPQQSPRIAQLLQSLNDRDLANALSACQSNPLSRTNFSIAHRGAPLKYAEHTRESYLAAAAMGAGVMECDVSFTSDGELVCRHAQCDLHTTTNIITTPLNDKCTVPWNEEFPNPGSVKCCTSDLTLSEFKSLRGRMDNHNPEATSAIEFLDGSKDWRQDVTVASGTLLSHQESIALFDGLGLQFTPELKSPDRDARLQVEDVFGSRQAYAQKLIDDYKQAGIRSTRVWAQSFQPDMVLYWLTAEPEFGRQAVMLDGRPPALLKPDDPATFDPSMKEMTALGVKVLAPPLWMLVSVDDQGKLIPSAYAKAASEAGLKIIGWSLERSDLRHGSRKATGELDWYYQFDQHPAFQTIQSEGDVFKLLDVLAKDVGVIGIFSDWPETVTFYANCQL